MFLSRPPQESAAAWRLSKRPATGFRFRPCCFRCRRARPIRRARSRGPVLWCRESLIEAEPLSSLSANDSAGPGAAIQPPAANPVASVRVARREDPLRGILLILGAVFFFSCSDAASKYLTGTLPALQVAWFRFV